MRKHFFTALAMIGLILTSCQAQQNSGSEMEDLSYSLGVMMAQSLKAQGFEDLDGAQLAAAVNDVLAGKDLKISADSARTVIQNYQNSLQDKVKEENLAYLETNKTKEGVKVTESGLQYKVLQSGDGASPAATDKVTVHYHGMLTDGTVFDSSVDRGEPASFPVNGVIPGWVEALQMMKVGDKWRLFIPYDLAYGERGAGGKIGPFATLIFDVELLSIDG